MDALSVGCALISKGEAARLISERRATVDWNVEVAVSPALLVRIHVAPGLD